MVIEKESIKDCMKTDDNPQNLVYEEVSTDELCTITIAKRLENKGLGKFDSKNYISGLEDSEKKDILRFGENLKTYKICDIKSDKIAYDNCALVQENPYITKYDDNGKYYCSFMQNLFPNKPIDDNFIEHQIYFDVVKESNKDPQPVLIMPKSDTFAKKPKEAFCESRWQDFFCVPNYHLNNKWLNYVPKAESGTSTIGICYKPCPIGYIPAPESSIFTSSLGRGACIMNTGQFSYLPIAFICLLGTTLETFKMPSGYKKYLEMFKEEIDAEKNYNFIEITQGDSKINIHDALITYVNAIDESTECPIWNGVKEDIKKYINDLFKAHTINDKFINILYNKSSDFDQYELPIYEIAYAYNIAIQINNIQTLSDKTHYKEWRKRLQNISMLDESQFKYQLQMLKKACNICFDGKTYPSYSKDYILFELRKIDPKVIEISINIYDDPKYETSNLLDFRFKRKKKIGLYDHMENATSNYKTNLDIMLYIIAYISFFLIIYILFLRFYEFFIYYLINTPLTLIYMLGKYIGYWIWYVLLYLFDTREFYRYINRIDIDLLIYKKEFLDAISNKNDNNSNPFWSLISFLMLLLKEISRTKLFGSYPKV